MDYRVIVSNSPADESMEIDRTPTLQGTNQVNILTKNFDSMVVIKSADDRMLDTNISNSRTRVNSTENRDSLQSEKDNKLDVSLIHTNQHKKEVIELEEFHRCLNNENSYMSDCVYCRDKGLVRESDESVIITNHPEESKPEIQEIRDLNINSSPNVRISYANIVSGGITVERSEDSNNEPSEGDSNRYLSSLLPFNLRIDVTKFPGCHKCLMDDSCNDPWCAFCTSGFCFRGALCKNVYSHFAMCGNGINYCKDGRLRERSMAIRRSKKRAFGNRVSRRKYL